MAFMLMVRQLVEDMRGMTRRGAAGDGPPSTSSPSRARRAASYVVNAISALVGIASAAGAWAYLMGNNQFIAAEVALVHQEYQMSFGDLLSVSPALAPT